MVLPFGDLAQVVYARNGPQFKKNEEAGGASAWNQTQLITVEPSIAIAKPQSHEQRNECLLPLGLGEVYNALLLQQEDE